MENSELKAAVQFSVIRCCLDEASEGGDKSSAEMTPRAIASLSELTYLFATTMLGPDLDAFRKHAGRTKITADDVKLVVRRNPELRTHLEAFASSMTTTSERADSTSNKLKRKPTKTKEATKRKKQQVLPGRPKGLAVNKMHFDGLDSDSSSSASAPVISKKKAPKAATSAALSLPIELQASSDSSDSDIEQIVVAKSAATSKEALSLLSSSDDDDGTDQPTRFVAAKPKQESPKKRRFRLSMLKSPKASNSPASDNDDDSHDIGTKDIDDILIDRHLHRRKEARKESQGVSMRIQQTLDALGDDSAPSDVDDENQF